MVRVICVKSQRLLDEYMFGTKDASVVYDESALHDPVRLNALNRLNLLDSPPEEAFDRVTRLLAKLSHVPVSVVSLVDEYRQFFKSQVGVGEPWATQRGTPLSHSFCQYVVMSGQPLIVEDARQDEMLRDNLAVPDLDVIAYAGVPLKTAKGDVLGSVCVIDHKPRAWTEDEIGLLKDLADTLAIEIDLRNKSLDLAEQNADLEAFAQTVAHDLKSPLSNVLGYIELLQLDLPTFQHEQLPYFEQSIGNIHTSANKMLTIINELLLLARVRKAEVAIDVVDMVYVMAAVQTRLASNLEASGAVLEMPSEWPAAFGYGPWIEEIWANYISNAIKYGGRPPHISLGAEHLPNGMIRFWVQDNGLGLTPEQQTRLFQPFVRLHKATINVEGHGLGLSIVQRIMEKLNGRVEVHSELGQGSTFSFILPAAKV